MSQEEIVAPEELMVSEEPIAVLKQHFLGFMCTFWRAQNHRNSHFFCRIDPALMFMVVAYTAKTQVRCAASLWKCIMKVKSSHYVNFARNVYHFMDMPRIFAFCVYHFPQFYEHLPPFLNDYKSFL